MRHLPIGRSRLAACASAAALWACAQPANAIIVVGKWDPQYGAPFNTPGVLGWQGQAQWFVPDACVPAFGTVSNGAACSGGAMSLLGATVDFYDYAADPTGATSHLTSLVYAAGSAPVASITFSGTAATGVNTGLSAALTPTGTSFDGIDGYSFALQFSGSNVQLFYAKNNQTATTGSKTDDDDECDDDDDACAVKPCVIGSISPFNCGVSSYTPSVTFTTLLVPEPQTYALMLAGLAVVGALARRRRV